MKYTIELRGGPFKTPRRVEVGDACKTVRIPYMSRNGFRYVDFTPTGYVVDGVPVWSSPVTKSSWSMHDIYEFSTWHEQRMVECAYPPMLCNELRADRERFLATVKRV